MDVWIPIILTICILASGIEPNRAYAQNSLVCDQNSIYLERWQENAEFRSRMTGDVWNYTTIAVSQESAILAVGNGNSLALYDNQSLTLEKELVAPNLVADGHYVNVELSSSGSLLVAGYGVFDSPDNPNPANGIQIWDVEHSQMVDFVPARSSTTALSSDGSIVAIAEIGGDISLWDVNRQVPFELYEGDRLGGSSTSLLSWSPDDRYLAATHDAGGALRLYLLGEKEPRLIESPDEVVTTVSWSPSGTQLATGSRATSSIRIFDVETGALVNTLDGSSGNVFEVQWSPDGTLLARGTQNGLFLWDMTTDNPEPIRAFDENMPPFVRIAWLPDSEHLISVDFEGSIYRWDVETGCVEAAVLKEWRPN